MKRKKRNLSTYSDEELLPLLRSGKPEAQAAFTEFYNRYASKVHAYCISMIGEKDQAEDIFQEVFVKFYDTISPDKEHSNIKSYLMTIARNLCLNHLRQKRPTLPVETMENLKTENISYEDAELYDLVLKAMDMLDEKYKEAFILREFDGLTYKEIAEILGLNLSNAKSRVLRARDKILKILEPYLDEVK